MLKKSAPKTAPKHVFSMGYEASLETNL